MKGSKLIELLGALAPKEVTHFKKFLAFKVNSSKTTLQEKLLDELHKAHPKFEERKVDRHKLYYKVYGEKKTKKEKIPSKFFDLASQVTLCLEEFLIYKQIEIKKTSKKKEIKKEDRLKIEERQRLLRWALDERGLSRMTKDLITKKIHELEEKTFKSSDDYYQLFRLNAALYNHITTQRTNPNNGNFQSLYYSFDLFYFIYKLRIMIELKSRKNLLIEDDEIEDLLTPHIISVIENQKMIENNPLLEYYYLLFELLNAKDNFDFVKINRVKTLFYALHLEFLKEDAIVGITILINLFHELTRKGFSEYIEEAWKILNYGLKHNLLIENGYLNKIHFQNTCVIGCMLDKAHEADILYQKYRHLLMEEGKKEVEDYCQARILFGLKKYQETLNFLKGIKVKDFFLKAIIRTVSILCNYKLENYEKMEMLMNSHKAFLRRDNNAINMQVHFNCMRIVELLYQAKYKSKITKNVMIKKIEETTPLAFVNFFLTEANKLR